MAKRRRRTRGRVLRFVLKAAAWLVLVLLLATALPTACFRWVDPPASSFMLQAHFRATRGDDYPVRHEWVDLAGIAPELQLAVIVAEDQRFPLHNGFDVGAIERALREAGRGGRMRGASTITQQVAKNLYLWPGRNLVRKGIEAWFTVLIEAMWPKQRILEIYLNVAEFGKGNCGAGAASRFFFDKTAAELTPEEAALLAAVLPNPRKLRAWNPGPYAQERTQEILGLMEKLGTGYLGRL